ncbi:hypothetical protein EZV62_003366 [Acer yangbiense]|uniref:AMP-dependent synthetase/ligase domain-containing protein n=1 Tax=Acer yangbiense TaxID=1000413 RepID=A0A5C7IH13_9ROSI|nr:hypothetical protein EZV62_003366 [Acer yangbiense]
MFSSCFVFVVWGCSWCCLVLCIDLKQTLPRTIYSRPVRIHFFCTMDPDSGFCSQTRTYHSLRQTIHDLPPPSQPLYITEYVFSLLHRYHSSSTTTISTTVSDPTTFMINDATGHRLTYSDLLLQTNSLAISLSKHYSLSKGDVAFILSPHSLQIPIIYF